MEDNNSDVPVPPPAKKRQLWRLYPYNEEEGEGSHTLPPHLDDIDMKPRSPPPAKTPPSSEDETEIESTTTILPQQAQEPLANTRYIPGKFTPMMWESEKDRQSLPRYINLAQVKPRSPPVATPPTSEDEDDEDETIVDLPTPLQHALSERQDAPGPYDAAGEAPASPPQGN